MNTQAIENRFDTKMRAAVCNYLYTVLVPVVRMLLRFGWSAPDAEKVVRWIFVRAFYSTPEFWRDGRPTALQGAIKVGISRQQVGKLNEIPEPQHVLLDQRHNLACRVIEGWVRDPAFQRDGMPLPLQLRHCQGPNFHRLVLKYAGDVTAGAVLADLQSAGCAIVVNGVATLVNQTYGINFFDEDMLAIVGYSQQKLAETVDHNICHADIAARRTQRLWWQSKVPADSAAATMEYLREASVNWGRLMDGEIGKRFTDENADDCVVVGFGIYAFQDVETGAENIRRRKVCYET